jgi:hypothetical protein
VSASSLLRRFPSPGASYPRSQLHPATQTHIANPLPRPLPRSSASGSRASKHSISHPLNKISHAIPELPPSIWSTEIGRYQIEENQVVSIRNHPHKSAARTHKPLIPKQVPETGNPKNPGDQIKTKLSLGLADVLIPKEFPTMYLSPILGAASQVMSMFSSNKAASSASPSAPSSTDPLSILDSSGNVDLSQAAQVFSKLQDLSQSNPTQFKQLTTQISSQLQTEAQSATGSASTFLSDLANQFQTASQTGNTSSLQTQTASPGGHHHGHHQSVNQAAYTALNPATDAQTTAQSILQSVQSL